MMRLYFCSLLCLFIAIATISLQYVIVIDAATFAKTSSAETQKKKHGKQWLKHSSSSEDDLDRMTINFKLFLPLNAKYEKLLHSERNLISTKDLESFIPEEGVRKEIRKSSSSPISYKLALWRHLLAPSEEVKENAKRSLRKHGLEAFCDSGLSFDHYHCKNVPHSLAKKIFKVEFEQVREQNSGTIRLSAVEHPHEVEKHFRETEKSFQYISDIKVHPHFAQRQSRQPRAKIIRREQKEDENNNNDFHAKWLPSSSPVPNSNEPILTFAYIHNTLTAPNYNPNDNDYGKLLQIIVTPICYDGKMPILVNQTSTSKKLRLTCASGLGNTPKTITWETFELSTPETKDFNDAGTAPSLGRPINSGSFDVSQDGACKRAKSYKFSNDSTVPFCMQTVSKTGQNPLIRGRPFVIFVSTIFHNGVKRGATGVNYFNESYFNPQQTTRFPNWNNAGDNSVPVSSRQDIFYKQHAMFGDAPNVMNGYPRSYAAFLPEVGLFADEIRDHYNVPSSLPNFSTIDHDLVGQGVIEFPEGSDDPEEQYTQSDVDEYMKYCGTKCQTGYDPNLLQYTGTNASLSPNGEATMDVELLMGIAPGIKTLFWTYNDDHDAGFGETMANIFHQMMTETGDVSRKFMQNTMNMSSPISSWSMSWSACEYDDGGSYINNMNRAATYVAALSSSGITFVASSGDAGTSCSNDDFFPFVGFPVNLPRVVAVGGTTIRDRSNTGSLSTSIEVSSSAMGDWITSGGGVSNVIPAPSYQQKMFPININMRKNVTFFEMNSDKYWPSSDPTNIDDESWHQQGSGLQGRGLPDVSALGALISTVSYRGRKVVSGGTSAASPIFAALITLINNERLKKNIIKNGNKTTTTSSIDSTTLQSIHDWLYRNETSGTSNKTTVGSNSSIFYDITVGDACAGKAASSVVYPIFPFCYSTRVGWDAVTGFGEVRNFSLLLDSALRWNPPPPPPPLPVNLVGILVGCGVILLFVGGLTGLAYFYKKRKNADGGSVGPADEWYANVQAAEGNRRSTSSGFSSNSSMKNYVQYQEEKNNNNTKKKKQNVDFYAGSV